MLYVGPSNINSPKQDFARWNMRNAGTEELGNKRNRGNKDHLAVPVFLCSRVPWSREKSLI
jgi:hypothetical protein